MSVAEAAEKADIIHILLPDESHGAVYEAEIKPHLKAGKTLCCSHGFAYVFNTIVPRGCRCHHGGPKGRARKCASI